MWINYSWLLMCGASVRMGAEQVLVHKLYSLGEMVAEGPNSTVQVPMERRATPGGGRASAQAVGEQPDGNVTTRSSTS